MARVRKANAPDARAFLGVERSLSGKMWIAPEADDALVASLSLRHGLPDIAARLLAVRGVSDADAAAFLDPTLKSFFPDPSSFADMDVAARVIEDAILSGRPTAVLADYDVDGATSAAQLVRYFRARGRSLHIYVPDRMTEGYGPSARAFDRLKDSGVDLVITVDCGTAAQQPLEHAAALGMDVVVIDHHLMSHGPPPSLACVNPNRPDCKSGQGHLTAAGVVLVALAAVNREARKRGSIGSNHLPDLMTYLDLAALGTVCDVAPLTGFNRALVRQGLKRLQQTDNAGLLALAESAGRKECGTVYDLGFVLGPRLNAGGRVGDSSLATRLLSTEDRDEARMLAADLEALNTDRRAREAQMLASAIARAKDDPNAVVVVGDPSWHPGVIGIAAGRVKDIVVKPVIVLGGGGKTEPAKGSGRSLPGVNLGRAVADAAKAGILHAGGGHAMAAGLTVEWARMAELAAFLSDALKQEIAENAGAARALKIDAAAGAGGLSLNLLDAIDRIGPFGAGHSEAVFALADVRISFSSAVKGDHVRFVLEDASGAKVRGIAFRAMASAIGPALLAKEGAFHAAVRLKRNSFNGRDSAEVELVDLAGAELQPRARAS
jgi:single-stranded-DNA-specific exonuclease